MDAEKKVRIHSTAVMCAVLAVSAFCLSWMLHEAVSVKNKIDAARAENSQMNAKIAAIASKCDFYAGIEKTLLSEDALYSGHAADSKGISEGYFRLESFGEAEGRRMEGFRSARAEYFRFAQWCGRLFGERPLSKPLFIRMEVPDSKIFSGEPALLDIDTVYSFERSYQ